MEHMANKLELLAQSLGVAVTEIHTHYVTWTIANSITWIVFGVCLILLAIFGSARIHKKMAENEELDHEDKLWLSLFACLVLFVGITIIASNVSNLISPQAKAWHYLLRDLN